MDVQVSGRIGAKGRHPLRQAAPALAIAFLTTAVVLAPGFAWPAWFRILSTVLCVLLGMIVVRAYVGAIASFRPAPAPPPKPYFEVWPRLSVLVPAYNEASVLPRTLASMLALDYPADRLEFVYVAEKRGTDGTLRLLQDFAARDRRIKVLVRDEPGGGKAAAANFGLRHCTGDLIVSLDADHALEPGGLRRAALHFIRDAGLGCLKGRAVGVNTRESFLALQAKVERDAIEKGDIYPRQVLGTFTFFGGGQAVFRRQVFDELGAFDPEILVEDVDFSIRMHAAGWRIHIDPGFVTYEENPAEFGAWWAQRKRWARGWMQVAVRYIPRLGRMHNATIPARLDMAHTLAYALVPVAFAVLMPLGAIGWLGWDTTTYFGAAETWLWTAYGLAPIVLAAAVLVQDLRDGVWHDWRELIAFATLGPYLMLQSIPFLAAFIDEFVLRSASVYVKTTKTGSPVPILAAARPLIVSSRATRDE